MHFAQSYENPQRVRRSIKDRMFVMRQAKQIRHVLSIAAIYSLMEVSEQI